MNSSQPFNLRIFLLQFQELSFGHLGGAGTKVPRVFYRFSGGRGL
jgi:hypothetical protein